MADWSGLTRAALLAKYPGSAWDILPGLDAPADMPVCATYLSLAAAFAALDAGGYRPAGHSIPAPGLAGPYDLTTGLKYTAGAGRDVVLIKRLES